MPTRRRRAWTQQAAIMQTRHTLMPAQNRHLHAEHAAGSALIASSGSAIGAAPAARRRLLAPGSKHCAASTDPPPSVSCCASSPQPPSPLLASSADASPSSRPALPAASAEDAAPAKAPPCAHTQSISPLHRLAATKSMVRDSADCVKVLPFPSVQGPTGLRGVKLCLGWLSKAFDASPHVTCFRP